MEILSEESSQATEGRTRGLAQRTSLFKSWSIPTYARRYYLCFGGITFFLLIIEVITGGILAIYYIPSVEKAYASVYYIHNFVNYGWLIRSIHYWAANLMIVFVTLHMLRVFVTGSYKSPRQFNWLTGIFLLNLTLGFAVTGGLLPWDQKSFWATTVMFSFLRKIPVIGSVFYRMMVGNEVLEQTALTRFYSFHIMILPVVVAVLLLLHFYMVKKQGISRPL